MKECYFEKGNMYYRTNAFLPDRQTLVFVHGLTGSASSWVVYEKIFENKFNILTYDIRGHGKSKKFPKCSDYQIKKFAEDLHELILHLNIQKFILIGHSFGTLIALEYLKSYQKNVLAGVLLSPIFNPKKKNGARILRQVLKPVLLFDLFKFTPKTGQRIDYAKYIPTTDWDLQRIYVDMRNTSLHVYLHCLKQAMAINQEYFLEKIEIPILLIHGNKDIIAGADNSTVLAQEIKNSKLLIIPKTNHFVMLNDVKKVAEAIESFIENNVNLYSEMVNLVQSSDAGLQKAFHR